MRIFEPYYKGWDDDIGRGLGLAVVRGIVQRHGGAGRALSKPGKGTTFQVDLPLAAAKDRKARSSANRAVPGLPRILVVDDEKMITVLTAKMLRRLGYELLGETESAEALTKFKEAPQDFDLIFTDYLMPQMTGADLAREILGIRPDIPAVMCTGFSAGLTREDAMKMGIPEIMPKPVDLNSLETVISKALTGKTRKRIDSHGNDRSPR